MVGVEFNDDDVFFLWVRDVWWKENQVRGVFLR